MESDSYTDDVMLRHDETPIRSYDTYIDLESNFAKDASLPAYNCTEGGLNFAVSMMKWARSEQVSENNRFFLIPPDTRCALVFQTPREYLLAALHLADPSAKDNDVDETWNRIGCSDIILDQAVSTLSTGERLLTLIAVGYIIAKKSDRGIMVNHSRSLSPDKQKCFWDLINEFITSSTPFSLHGLKGDPTPLTPTHALEFEFTKSVLQWELSIDNLSIEYEGQYGISDIPRKKIRYHSQNTNLKLISPTLIIGDNGVGKSTLAKLLCRISQPSHGSFRITTPISRSATGRMLFTDTALQLFSLSPLRHLDEIFRLDSVRKKEALTVINEIKDTLRTFTAPDGAPQFRWEGDTIDEGIFGARVALIAERLASNAGVLILDEPSSLVTSHEAAAFLSAVCITAHKRSVPVIIITHDQALMHSMRHGSTVSLQRTHDDLIGIKILKNAQG